jgi:membrane protein involved in D-alanine export
LSPYSDFVYFLFLLYPVLPAILLGLLGRLGWRYVLLATVAMVVFEVANPLGAPETAQASMRQLTFLGLYAVGGVAVILVFAWVRRRAKSQPAFYAAIVIALLPLVGVKVYPLAAAGHWLGIAGGSAAAASTGGAAAATLAPGLFDAFGFLGISYVTFRIVDAIVSVHDGLVKEPPTVGGLVSYLFFFPTLSAGPIDRYLRFANNLGELPHRRRDYLFDLEAGIARIFQGFLYKFILAELLFRYVLDPAAKVPGVLGLAEYAYGYIFYLFFDFAGYSAFAIGVGRLFGIHVPENFNAPFLSRNFTEMWNRWHISLSWLLRDHIYRRFLLTATRRKWFGGNRNQANYTGLMLTMLTMGIWHGLTLHYLVYGLYQGTMLVLSDVVGRWNRQRKVVPAGWLSDVGGVILTFNLFTFGVLIFSGHLFQ